MDHFAGLRAVEVLGGVTDIGYPIQAVVSVISYKWIGRAAIQAQGLAADPTLNVKAVTLSTDSGSGHTRKLRDVLQVGRAPFRPVAVTHRSGRRDRIGRVAKPGYVPGDRLQTIERIDIAADQIVIESLNAAGVGPRGDVRMIVIGKYLTPGPAARMKNARIVKGCALLGEL